MIFTDNFFQEIYSFIDERLEPTYKKLWNKKDYKNLIKKQGETYDSLYEKLDTNFQKVFESYMNLSNDIKEDEKYHIYLTGLLDGIQLYNYLKRN